MTFYIIDTTLQPPQEKRFSTYPQVVQYLEGISSRAGQSRRDRMILMEECGHGADDRDSVTFVRAMADQYNIGVVRDGRRMRCDITNIAMFSNENYGN